MKSTSHSKIALLGNLIDYAGTFPPAALSFEEALKEAATCRKTLKAPWLLSKMALPIADLKKLSSKMLIDSGSDGSPWLFTALGTPAETTADATEYARAVEWDLREVKRFNERGFEGSCRHFIIAYESKLPTTVLASKDADTALAYLSPTLTRMASHFPSSFNAFFEISIEDEFRPSLASIAEALASWNDSNQEISFTPGLKVRTGGKVVPTSEQLAEVVRQAVRHGLRFKATQGLHAAVTHGNDFGFVNLFGALSLAQVLGEEAFGLGEIRRCLESEDPRDFVFSPTSFSWKGHKIDCELIEAARRKHAGCFGSCSIVEPDDSLCQTFPT